MLLGDDVDAAHDEIDHLTGHAEFRHKRDQAAFFDDSSASEFEITRPHGAPALYAWLLGEKMSRATRGIEKTIAGGEVLVVCGGSGMDAEFYARMGARVISSDISLGAARRTAERSQRFGLGITAIVADAERLPFEDRSIDVVAVHDGLHHLKHPERSLAEMARVSAQAVSVTEPADAAITAVAVRLGVAKDLEDSGNRVARLNLAEVSAQLSKLGFGVVRADRYLMYYRHVPGGMTRLLSYRAVLPLVQFGLAAINWLAGRFGNKMVVVATRRHGHR